MAVIGWGKPRIFYKKVNDKSAKWAEFATPSEGSTQLSTTKGDKTEAKLEGGANEAVKYGRNTYALTFNIRAAAGRTRPLSDDDGIITDEYAIVLQPEDANAPGFAIEASTASVEDSFTSADGGVWIYTFDAVVPEQTGFAESKKQVQWGVVDVTNFATGDITLDGKSVAPNPSN